MTEQAVTTIVTSVAGGVTTVLLAWIGFLQFKAKIKLDEISRVAETTHKLVNSGMSIQLAMHRNTTHHFAEAVPTAFNIEAAAAAKRAYDDHLAKQAMADARPK